jgi:hypothetical protein
VIDVNLTGGYTMSKFAVPLMMKQKYGRIVFVTRPWAIWALPARPTTPLQGRPGGRDEIALQGGGQAQDHG